MIDDPERFQKYTNVYLIYACVITIPFSLYILAIIFSSLEGLIFCGGFYTSIWITYIGLRKYNIWAFLLSLSLSTLLGLLLVYNIIFTLLFDIEYEYMTAGSTSRGIPDVDILIVGILIVLTVLYFLFYFVCAGWHIIWEYDPKVAKKSIFVILVVFSIGFLTYKYLKYSGFIPDFF